MHRAPAVSAAAGRSRGERARAAAEADEALGCPRLVAAVQEGLERRWSLLQISSRLKLDHPDDEGMRISHETIYRSLYVRKPVLLVVGGIVESRALDEGGGEYATGLDYCVKSFNAIGRPGGKEFRCEVTFNWIEIPGTLAIFPENVEFKDCYWIERKRSYNCAGVYKVGWELGLS